MYISIKPSRLILWSMFLAGGGAGTGSVWQHQRTTRAMAELVAQNDTCQRLLAGDVQELESDRVRLNVAVLEITSLKQNVAVLEAEHHDDVRLIAYRRQQNSARAKKPKDADDDGGVVLWKLALALIFAACAGVGASLAVSHLRWRREQHRRLSLNAQFGAAFPTIVLDVHAPVVPDVDAQEEAEIARELHQAQ
jgi:hypothetical protein